MSYLDRLCALIPEIEPATVEKIVSLLQKEIPSWEIADCLGLGTDQSSVVLAVKQSSMFLVQHRMARVELPAPSPDTPAQIVDSLSDDQALELLSRLYEKREALIKAKISTL